MTTTTTTETTTGLTVKDAYEIGRYVGRHYGTPGAMDRQVAFDAWIEAHPTNQCLVEAPQWRAFWLGRDRSSRGLDA